VPDEPLNDSPVETPEARRREALRWQQGLRARIRRNTTPGSRTMIIAKRVFAGVWRDGFIHAGNFAYMTLLSVFPFFIAMTAMFAMLGASGDMDASISSILATLPSSVRDVLQPVIRTVVNARHGWLLWIGGLFGLWTATSMIETIRDILRRSYGTRPEIAMWRSRLFSALFVFAAVLAVLVSLSAQVFISTLQEVIFTILPGLDSVLDQIAVSRLVTAGTLYASLYLLIYLLTPPVYQSSNYPKWPGAALITAWWLLVTVSLPKVMHTFFTYDLTYGSLAGVMIALFFFWLVGLGMVFGAELNAALAETPEEQAMLEEGDRPGAPATEA